MHLDEIIERSCKNDPAGQRALFNMFAGKVMTVCRRYSNNVEDAREMSQECFYQVLTCIEKYDSSKGEFEGWLYKLCYYTILNIKKKSIKFYELNSSVLEVQDEEPEEYPISTETLLSEIQKLPEGYKLILNLYVFEGLTHDEIADVLEISASTSRSQLARARALLKKRLLNHNSVRYASRSI